MKALLKGFGSKRGEGMMCRLYRQFHLLLGGHGHLVKHFLSGGVYQRAIASRAVFKVPLAVDIESFAKGHNDSSYYIEQCVYCALFMTPLASIKKPPKQDALGADKALSGLLGVGFRGVFVI